MKTSQFLFILAGLHIFTASSKGTAGVIVYAVLPIGLSIVGAYLLVNGH